MPHKLTRLVSSLYNEPMLMNQVEYENIVSYIKERTISGITSDYTAAIATDGRMDNPAPSIENGFGFLRVQGAISHLSSPLQAWCGMTSYQTLIQDMEDIAADGSVHTVIMDVDSGGGAAKFCFEAANRIRAIADEHDIKLIAYTETVAASAAYALPAVAHEFIAAKDADIGSIGVITQMVNYSKQLEEAGIEVVTIKSGEFKDLGNPTAPVREADVAIIQERVDSLASDFMSHVATHRGISEDTVRGLQAKVFTAKESLDIGLIDKVMSPFEFQDYLNEIHTEKSSNRGNNMNFKLKSKEKGEEMSINDVEATKLAELEAKLEELMSTNADLSAQVTAKEEQAAQALALAQEKELAVREGKLAELTVAAKAFANFGLDAEQFATFALDADEALVGNITAALSKASEMIEATVETEIGVEVEGEAPIEPTAKSTTAEKINQKYSTKESK